MLRFDWDERKNRRNRAKHGVWFEEAQSVFSDPHARLFDDPEHSEGEDRFIPPRSEFSRKAAGRRPLLQGFQFLIRIISARKATKKEGDFMKKEYDFSKLKELKNSYASKKKAVGINLSSEVVDYFKGLADETGLPYQKLIDLYLLDCAKKRKKLTMKWVA
jgi:uncharacterized DUF497 family protein